MTLFDILRHDCPYVWICFQTPVHTRNIVHITISTSQHLDLIMRSEDQKKIAAHYGVLCGLRSEPDSDSDNSIASRPSPKQEAPSNGPVTRPRPESLTLPFENRERESHLVSQDELDRIIRQEELENPLPPLASGLNHRSQGAGLRRSISTARNTRVSMLSQRPRPMSADFSRMMANTADQCGQHGQNQVAPAALPRDPTLTAMPRAPTKNDLLGKHDDRSYMH